MTEPDPFVEEVRRKAARMARARRDQRGIWATLARAGSVGWQLALPLVAGAVGGRALALWTGVGALALVGLALGLAGGLWGAWRAISASTEDP